MQIDVAIVGGGLAGNLLARQLRRQLPSASVAVFEKSTERTYKVGESTVEIATNYLVRRVGLSTYIYKEHLPKNGLRYFFDTPERNATLPSMSEIGIHGLPPYPSFQIDRARFENDLLQMNAADGVDVRLGARVKNIEIQAGQKKFTVVQDGMETQWSARWLIDCTGRESMLAKQLELRVPEKNHKIAAAWGRVRGVADMDDFGGEEWRREARYTARVLSTNHFMYPGYWIWLIPLREGLTSIGVVQERGGWNVERHKAPGFLEFLREHKALESLLQNAEFVDIDAFTQLAFRTKQFFSADGWACLGDAAAFPDPFYSPGSDFIAVENDLVADLIARDFAGEALTERTAAYNDFMQFRFDTTMVIYERLYPTFGSYDLFRAKAFFDTGCYYNLLFDSYCRDEHLDLKFIRSSLRRRHFVMQVLESFGQLFARAGEEMKKRGTYFKNNLGQRRLEGREAFGVMEDVGAPRSRREINAHSEMVFARTQEMVANALDGDRALVKELMGGPRDAWSQLSAP